MVCGSEAHVVERCHGIGEADLVQLVVVIVVRVAEVVGVVVEVYLRVIAVGVGNGLVVRHRAALSVRCPVIAVGGEAEDKLVVGDVLCRPVGSALYPVLRCHVAGCTCGVVLVVCHEEEVVVVACQLL